jgi:hypothetical protein
MASVPPGAGEDRVSGGVPPAPKRIGARRAPMLALIAVVLVVAGIIAAVIGLQPRPTPSRGAEPPVAALIVSVSHTGDPVVNLGFPTTLTVRALGDQPIASIELWLGARLLASASNTDGGPAQVARWTWTPGAAGPAVLVARATDAKGREAQSAALRLTVSSGAPKFRPVRPVTVLEGETANDAALRAGGEPGGIAPWNAGIDLLAPLEAGTVVYVPLPVRDVPKPDVDAEIQAATGLPFLTADSAPTGPGTVTLAAWHGAGPSVTLGPTAADGLFVPPEVQPTVESCTIMLAVNSDATNATGLALYGLAPGGTTFARLDTFAGGGGTTETFTTAAAAGAYLFSVSTYDGAVEEQGDLVSVEVPEECGDPGWSGGATLSQGRLIVDGEVDRAYLYLSQEEGPWRRVPEDPDAFVDRIGGELDFGPYLPVDLATTAVDIEAWGWGGAGLLPLGTGHQEPQPTPGTAPPPVAGGSGADLFAGGTFTSLDWIARHATAGTPEIGLSELLAREGELTVWILQGGVKDKVVEDFRWQTNATGVDAVVWQVAAFPISPDIAPDAPGLLLQDVVHVAEDTQKGDFPIDFRPIFAPPKQTSDIGDVLSGGIVEQLSLPLFNAFTSAAPTLASPKAGSATQAYSPSALLEQFTPSVLYIRAIPMDGAKVAGKVSNFVKLVPVGDQGFLIDPNATFPPGPVPTPAPTGGLKPYSLALQFLPPANANPAFANCVVVVEITPDAKPNLPPEVGGLGDLKEGDFFCLFTGSSSGWSLAGAFEDFVDAVADAWDAVTEAWSWLQQQLASAIATYSGCSALAGGEFCEGLASVAISVALTSVGIPPSLPNTKELMNLAKGELKDAMVDLASKYAQASLGFDPCSADYLTKQGLGTALCDDLADQLVDDLIAQLDAMKTQEAIAITGVVVPIGVNVVQHPWGTLRPPRFRVTIARNLVVPLPTAKECRMKLSMTAYVPNWTHKYLDGQTLAWGTTTENVAGSPFVPLTMAIPDPSKAEGAVELPGYVPKDATVYEKLLAAFNAKVLISRDYYLTETNFWREPNNPTYVYKPGQGYINFWDQSNRAWVLLQNGTAVSAGITVPSYSADCFDTVIAYGAISWLDQGSPCTPSYGWWWETIKHPFTGTFEQQLKCSVIYKEAVAY